MKHDLSSCAPSRRGVIQGAIAAGFFGGMGAARAQPADSSLIERIVDAARAVIRTPPEVEARTAWCVLDGLGVMAFTSRLPQLRPFLAYAAGFRSDRETLIPFTARRAAPEMAAAASAFLIHGSEIDDTDLRSLVHPTAVLLPPVLAAAQLIDCSGAEFLRALALAYTLQSRLGGAAQPLQRIGWMASAVYGPPAAALGAATLLRLSARQTAWAIALAADASGGLLEYYYDNTEEKRVEAARAARSALESARLAAEGEAGATRALDGPAGLYRVIARQSQPDVGQIIADLGRLEGPLYVMPKFYASAEPFIPLLDAIAATSPAEIRPAQVRSFIVRGGEPWASMLADKINHFEPPTTKVGAMLNLNFVVALYLSRRSNLVSEYESGLHDPQVLALASRGAFQFTPEARDMSVEFQLSDGRRVLAEGKSESGELPLMKDRRLAKFETLAGRTLGPRADALRGACLNLPSVSSMRAWAARYL